MLNMTIGIKAIIEKIFGFWTKKCSDTIPSFLNRSLLYALNPYQPLTQPIEAIYNENKAALPDTLIKSPISKTKTGIKYINNNPLIYPKVYALQYAYLLSNRLKA